MVKDPYGLLEMKIKPLNNKNGWKEYITKFIGKDDEIDFESPLIAGDNYPDSPYIDLRKSNIIRSIKIS